MSTKTTSAALAESRALKYAEKKRRRVYSESTTDLYGEPATKHRKEGCAMRWIIRRDGDNNSHRHARASDREIARVTTDNKKVVCAIIDALLPFHLGDQL